jgi:hypothetical protein
MYGKSGMREIKRITTYEEAKLRYEQIKPIRGRAGDVRPLGSRGNDSYRIAKRVNPLSGITSYQCILYSTPVVEFKPDGDVEIVMGGWGSTATRTFIERVLYLSCYSKNGSSVLCLGNKAEVVLHPTKTTVIRRVVKTAGEPPLQVYPSTWELALGEPVYETQLNKKKANNVRQQYSEFEKYLKAMVNLREETRMDDFQGGKYAYKRITFTANEFTEAQADGIGHRQGFPVELMRNDQPEESKHSNFYKAALGIVLAIRGGPSVRSFSGSELHLESSTMLPKFREILYRHQKDEVFEKVLLPVGKAASKKYDSWVK